MKNRIPKPTMEQCKVPPERPPRDGWKEAFAAAGSSAGDPLLFETLPANEFDAEQWTW